MRDQIGVLRGMPFSVEDAGQRPNDSIAKRLLPCTTVTVNSAYSSTTSSAPRSQGVVDT